MPLFDTFSVLPDEISEAVHTHWGLYLRKLIKESQNHTYLASNLPLNDEEIDGHSMEQKYIVRVSKNDEKHLQHISDEVFLVNYLKNSQLCGVCGYLTTINGEPFLRTEKYLLVVMEWANGQLIDFMKLDWIHNEPLIYAWGRWMGEFHNTTRLFLVQHPDVASRIQTWRDIHCGILRDTRISPEDEIQWPHEDLGILHGDLNLSNFHYEIMADNTIQLHVFDWDQIQQGYWELDIAQACLTPFMLNEGGALGTGEIVPQAAHPEQFLQQFVAGYHSISTRPVNIKRLDRMIMNRRVFYKTFATCALRDEAETIPIGMKVFLEYILRWTEKVDIC